LLVVIGRGQLARANPSPAQPVAATRDWTKQNKIQAATSFN